MELDATFADSIASDLKLPKNAKTCGIIVTSLVDERRSPEMIGVYSGRAIHAPGDRDTWFRSMVTSLKSRNIAVAFAAEASQQSGAMPVEIVIAKAWIANTDSNMSASIVFRLKSWDIAGAVVEQSHRGGASHMSYWSGGPGELQRAFDTAIARGLDALAADVHNRCSTIA